MAYNNIQMDNLAVGDDVATDLISAVHYQLIKMGHGAEGTYNECTTSTPLPVTTAAPATGATELAKAVDAASGASDVGIASLVVRDDTLTTLTPVDGDYVHLRVSSTGALWTAITNTVTVDLGANNDVTIDNSSIVHAEDAAHASGNAGIMPLAVRNDDLAALAGADGDYAPLQVTQNGALLMCAAANDDYKYAAIDAATSGNNTLVAAVTARKIRVLSCVLVGAGDVDVRFEDGANGTALTGQMDVTANSGFTLPFNPAGWFETTANTLLNLELSAAVSVDGCLTYIEVA